MKLFGKGILYALIFLFGISLANASIFSTNYDNVQAATLRNKKRLSSRNFYYRISKNRLVKASDVKVITKIGRPDSNMVSTNIPNDFKLKITNPRTVVYKLNGEKTSKRLSKGKVIEIGDKSKWFNDSYYKNSKNKMIHVSDSTWI